LVEAALVVLLCLILVEAALISLLDLIVSKQSTLVIVLRVRRET
jgi:hypothetical protein